jgi:hypothetical protein
MTVSSLPEVKMKLEAIYMHSSLGVAIRSEVYAIEKYGN